MDLNKAMIIGRLTRDPEVRTTPQGTTVCSFGVATNFIWNNSQGQKQEKVEFHNIVAWRKLAEICGQYLRKGSKVYLEGRLQTREWEGQDGNKRQRTEIVADNMIMLDSRGAANTMAGDQVSQGGFTPQPQQNQEKKTEQNMTPSTQSGGAAQVTSGESDSKKEEVSVEDIPF